MRVRGLVRRQRERALASDVRAGRWARGKARRLQREFVRRNWRIIFGVGGGLLVLIAAAAPLFPGAFSRGLYLGSFGTSVVALMAFWVVQATGTASIMMGDEGERWTAQELRRLRPGGWRLINHISFEGSDVDHVLIGPGGAFAIETKWTANDWERAEVDGRVVAGCRQAADNARRLSLWLRPTGVGQLRPILFLWGNGSRALPPVQSVEVDGRHAVVVAGPSARAWTSTLVDDQLDNESIHLAWSTVDAYCSSRDPQEDTESPVPLSYVGIAGRAFAALLSGSASLLIAATWLGRGLPMRWWLPLAIGLALPAIALWHFARGARYLALGWFGGLFVSVALVLYGLGRWAFDQL